MTFVNEEVPKQDIEKYGLREINKKFLIGDFEYEWTIDRERDIYLRWMCYDPEEPSENDFSFYWKGILLTIRLKRRGEGVRGGKGSTTWAMQPSMGSTSLWLPKELESKREEIIADLKDALRAFKDFGLGSTIADHTAYFEF
jgi:hypothetical protein